MRNRRFQVLFGTEIKQASRPQYAAAQPNSALKHHAKLHFV
jgi:hypothetical protein